MLIWSFCLVHNGFDVDRKLASRVSGIDVVLTGHTHDALPAAVKVNKTLLIASGSHGKFLSRLDLDVRGGEMKGYRYKLMPVFSDVVAPDAEMAALISEIRAPYKAELETVLGRTESTLYRRGNLNGTFDDVICNALMEQRDAEIALSPGFRWGATLIPGQDITVEDVHNMTSITYPATYRTPMTGELLKTILEDVADNLFNADPYYQQGGDMVRVGGMGFTIDPSKDIGGRIGNMTLLKDGSPIDASREYMVAGWASVNEGTEGPPIWDVVGYHIRAHGSVTAEPHDQDASCRRLMLDIFKKHNMIEIGFGKVTRSDDEAEQRQVRRGSRARRKFLAGAAVLGRVQWQGGRCACRKPGK